MPDPFTAVGVLSACIGFTKELIKLIDLATGCCTKNTPAAALWVELLSGLRTEISNAKVQLRLVTDEVEPLRYRRGSGADAANRTRQEVGFDDLIQELETQLRASHTVFVTATNQFKDQGYFDWALLEAFDTKARKSTAPMKDHSQELKRIRWRIHVAQQSIINAFLLNCHDSFGGQFSEPGRLGTIRDQLAHDFLWPEPFCKGIETEDVLASGLLICNKTDLDLKELRKSIKGMGRRWVRLRDPANSDDEKRCVDGNAANNRVQHRRSTIDVLEGCQKTVLVQLQGVFDAIIKGGAPLTSDIATRGRCTLDEWRSICVAANGGIVIALGGKMSAGKSSIINAMLGESLLPVAQRICTAVPCRLVHVFGQTKPTLSIPWLDPYVECLNWIKTNKPSINYCKSENWNNFVDRDRGGVKMLARIEGEECPELKAKTEGGEAIKQMKFLNALVRICRAFEQEVNMGTPIQWPSLSVEFTGLKHYCENLPGSFTLLDLPGYNDDIDEDDERFRDLMIRAARQADVVVPVIAGPTMEKGNKWAKNIIRSEWSTRISSVIVTKLDLVENETKIHTSLPVIAKECDILVRNGCILLCDTIEGMAAMRLQVLLDEIEHKYAKDPFKEEGVDERWQKENATLIARVADDSKNNDLHRLYETGFEKRGATFKIKDWRDLVEARLDSSQLRRTCDQLAATTIEEARRLRLARFIEEMEDILKALVSSLSITLCLNRTSLDKLHQTQRQTEETLSNLRNVLVQWRSRIDEVRTRQEDELNKVLRKFERAARDSADNALQMSLSAMSLSSSGFDGRDYHLKPKKAEKIIQKCRDAVLVRLTGVVDDTIRDLGKIWKENQNAVLSLLRNATVNIETHPQLAGIIQNTIDQLEKVKQLDPEKLRIAMFATPGEVVVDATSKKFWSLSGLKQKFNRSGGLKAIEYQSTPPASPPVLPSSTPVACQEVSVVNQAITSESPHTNFAGLAAAMITPNIEEKLREIMSGIQGSVPTVQEIAEASRDNPEDTARVNGQGLVHLPQETLRKSVFETSLVPLVSRIKAGAESSMTESLDEMAALAQKAVVGALEECNEVIEKQLRAIESDNTKQVQTETLERLVCWGNLVAAQGVIKEMKRKKDEPVARVPAYLSPSSPIVASPGPLSPSLKSPAPSFANGLSN